jgi:hypothetical protein
MDGVPLQVVELPDRDLLLRKASSVVRRVPLVTVLNGQADGVTVKVLTKTPLEDRAKHPTR